MSGPTLFNQNKGYYIRNSPGCLKQKVSLYTVLHDRLYVIRLLLGC